MPNMTSYLVELSRKLNSENKPHLILQYQWQINNQLNYSYFFSKCIYTSFKCNSSLTFLFWPVFVFLKDQKVILWCNVSRCHHSWKMAKIKSALGLVLLGQDGLKLLRKRNVLKEGWTLLLSFRGLPISIHQRFSYLYRYIWYILPYPNHVYIVL